MRVAVVGLGIAGLRTAMLLERAGVEVVAYEARSRVGGRLETVAVEGGWYEAGGEWIDSDHARTISLLGEFGLAPESSDPRPGRLVWNGHECRDDHIWPDAEQDVAHIRAEAFRLAAGLGDPPWEHARDLDRPLAEFLDRQATSPRGRWLIEAVTRSDEGDDTDRLSLLGWIVGHRQYLGRSEENSEMSSHRFPGGAGRLCEAMAGRLRAEPRLGRPLRGLQQSARHVELWFPSEVAVADRVVLAIPPGPFGAIDLAPDWPECRCRAFRSLGRGPAVKVALEFTDPFWERGDGVGGSVMADLPFQQVWVGGRDGAPVLLAYVVGRQAEAFARDPESAVATVLRSLDEALPGAREAYRRGRLHDWVGDPWSQGGFSSLPVGAVYDALPWLREPWGRVHFAGEHTADWLGFVEGALESAERAVGEVLAAVGAESTLPHSD